MTPCGPFVTMSRRMITLTFLNLPKQAIAIYEPSCIPVVPYLFFILCLNLIVLCCGTAKGHDNRAARSKLVNEGPVRFIFKIYCVHG